MAIALNPERTNRDAAVPMDESPRRTGGVAGLLRRLVNPVKSRDILVFTSQLSLMLEVGTPLKETLRTIGEQTENEALRDLVQAMARDIEEGHQLSEAMRRHPDVFDGVFTSMVRAGETGGFLKEILDRLVEIQEKRQALRTQLRSALTYPVVLCLAAFLVVVFVIVWVLPKFTALFAGRESVLPMTTRFMMAASASMKGYWWVYILSGTALFLGLLFFRESGTGRALVDRISVSVPLISRISNKIYTCQLLRILGSLMTSDVPLLESLEVTRGTISNRYFNRFIAEIMEHVKEGGSFSRPFSSYPYILKSVKQMIATGEETGNLPKVMLRLALFYDTEVEQELKNASSLIEPFALILMGGVVGLIVSSVILPLFRLASTVH